MTAHGNDLIQLSKTTYQWLTLRRKSQPLAAWMEVSTTVLIPICPNRQVGRRNTGVCYIHGNWNENKETYFAILTGFRNFRSGMWLGREWEEKRRREIKGQARQGKLFCTNFSDSWLSHRFVHILCWLPQPVQICLWAPRFEDLKEWARLQFYPIDSLTSVSVYFYTWI